jgi:hypothetical protein
LAVLVFNPAQEPAMKADSASQWMLVVKLGIAVALAFAVTAMLRFALSPMLAPSAAPAQTANEADIALRSRIAPIVLGIGSAAIVLLALVLVIGFVVLDQNHEKPVADKIDSLLTGVFAAVLPVFATWVGTVIAFYFTNESFRQAAQVARESGSGLAERLRSTSIKSSMLPRARMRVFSLSAEESLDATKLKDVRASFDLKGDNGERISRLLILDSSDRFVAVLHRSVWMELYANALETKDASVKLEELPLGPLINKTVAAASGPTYRDLMRTAVAYFGVDRTLADAKGAMETVTGAQDVIVTQTGAPTTPVVGWIMNADIARLSQA